MMLIDNPILTVSYRTNPDTGKVAVYESRLWEHRKFSGRYVLMAQYAVAGMTIVECNHDHRSHRPAAKCARKLARNYWTTRGWSG